MKTGFMGFRAHRGRGTNKRREATVKAFDPERTSILSNQDQEVHKSM